MHILVTLLKVLCTLIISVLSVFVDISFMFYTRKGIYFLRFSLWYISSFWMMCMQILKFTTPLSLSLEHLKIASTPPSVER